HPGVRRDQRAGGPLRQHERSGGAGDRRVPRRHERRGPQRHRGRRSDRPALQRHRQEREPGARHDQRRRPKQPDRPQRLAQLERLASTHAGGTRAPSKRMLVIVNPYATTVSDRLKNLVVYALRGRYEVEAIDTTERGHASALAREAAHEGYDVVVAFGGDGTVNEAANGLVGSPTP